tara:strand:- start:192 stop:713 length:522 start_codon:yes stop_codon:yes gene_type:complete
MYAVTLTLFKNIIFIFPIIFLFVLVFTGFDLTFFFSGINISFNFIYIIIFYWILKKPKYLGYGFIFFAGLVNDVVQNYPIGISSINYLLLCAIAAFIRTRTLLPNLIYDWILFFLAIIIINSINYSILSLIFNFPIKYATLMFSSFVTFLAYPIFSKFFDIIDIINLRNEDAE